MESDNIIKIDVAKVLKSKAPRTKVPKFIINLLRKIIHEDGLNNIFKVNAGLENIDFIEGALRLFNAKASLIDKENLPPTEGKYIFASNHPLGGLDGMILGYLLGREYNGKVRLVTNDLLMNVEPLKGMFIPVNKVGSQGKSNAEHLKNFFESDDHLITFPSGMCSRKIKGEIIDLEWKKSFITKAIQYKRDIVPIYFEGRNSSFFYNLAKFRKFIGLKINLEMLFLVDEMFKQSGNHFTIHIGKPIPWQTFDKSKTHAQWAQWIKDIVYKMKQT